MSIRRVSNSYDTQPRHGNIGSAMQLYEWDQVEKEQLSPTFARQVIHGDNITVARVYLSKGCFVPEHSHHNEQISMMEQGRLKFVIGGVEKVLAGGGGGRIRPTRPH